MVKKKVTQSVPAGTAKAGTTKTVPPKAAAPASKVAAAPEVAAAEEKPHFDVAQQVYSVAKSAWSFGRSIPVGGAILGLYEVAAAKVVDKVVHKDLTGVDAEIKPHLAGLDRDVLDPAIEAVIKFFTPAVERSGEVVTPMVAPIVRVVMKVFPKQIEQGGKEKDKKVDKAALKEAEKEATMPEVSTPVVAPTVAVN